jgi:hypothetical protein
MAPSFGADVGFKSNPIALKNLFDFFKKLCYNFYTKLRKKKFQKTLDKGVSVIYLKN